jgi:hypothetical protein
MLRWNDIFPGLPRSAQVYFQVYKGVFPGLYRAKKALDRPAKRNFPGLSRAISRAFQICPEQILCPVISAKELECRCVMSTIPSQQCYSDVTNTFHTLWNILNKNVIAAPRILH